jgi:hypothetical protein
MEAAPDQLSEQFLPPVRSQFLTILCILSFIGSAYGLFRAVTIITERDKVVKVVTQSNPQAEAEHRKRLKERKDKGAKFEMKMMESMKAYTDKNKLLQKGIADLIANLLTLGGAILMWRMNRTGYFIYVAGILAWILGPVIIFGTGSFIAVMESGLGFFAGLLFCILYAMNLKDMRKEKVIV